MFDYYYCSLALDLFIYFLSFLEITSSECVGRAHMQVFCYWLKTRIRKSMCSFHVERWTFNVYVKEKPKRKKILPTAETAKATAAVTTTIRNKDVIWLHKLKLFDFSISFRFLTHVKWMAFIRSSSSVLRGSTLYFVWLPSRLYAKYFPFVSFYIFLFFFLFVHFVWPTFIYIWGKEEKTKNSSFSL